MNTKFEEFFSYVESFYGKGGLYDMGVTKEMIVSATLKYLDRCKPDFFCGDSVDREYVRDIMIEDFGLVFPNSGA